MSSKTKTTDMNEEAKTALVPKLRFPEFREIGEWIETTVGRISDTVIAGGTPSTSVKRFWGGEIRWMNSGELNDKKVFEVQGRITQEGLNNSSTKLIPQRCVLIGLAGQGKTRGTVAMNLVELCTNQSIAAIFPNHSVFNCDFLYHDLDKRYDELRRLSAGGEGRGGLNLQIIKSLKVVLPTLAEQQRIAECLSSLDELIAAQARKVDALKTHKKGLMQQLFPREGETQPRLRFPEFQNGGEWEEGKLISLSSEPLSNGVFNDPKKVGSGYKLINVSDMYIDTTIDEARLSLLELAAPDFRANQVMQGDIFFTRSSLVKSGIAVSNIYLGNSDDVTYDGHLIRLRPDTNKVVPLFAHYLFKTPPIRAHLIARGKSATMTTIGQADVASVTLCYPPKAEQQRLATCLSSLDDLITAETQKIEAFKTHKKGLMQQLFPSPEEVEA